jgi:hypothetical protein
VQAAQAGHVLRRWSQVTFHFHPENIGPLQEDPHQTEWAGPLGVSGDMESENSGGRRRRRKPWDQFCASWIGEGGDRSEEGKGKLCLQRPGLPDTPVLGCCLQRPQQGLGWAESGHWTECSEACLVTRGSRKSPLYLGLLQLLAEALGGRPGAYIE